MALLRTATKFSSTYSQRVVQHNTRTTIRTTSQPKVLSANYSLWQKNSVNEIKTPLAASTNATRWYATGDVIDIKVPPMGDSITEGVLHTWVKAKGDSVDVDETIGQIETDKVEVDIRAPTAGTITDLLVEESDTVQVDQKIAVLTEGVAAAKPAEPAKSAEPAKAQTEAPKKEEAKKPEQPKSAPTPPPTAPKVDKPAGSGERRERMRPIRVRTAERLKASQNTAALLTTFQHASLGNLIDMRTTHKDAFLKKHGVKLGFMSAFVKASCNALQQFPIVNAHIDGNDIVHKDSVDISIAVATPRGLLVPVLRQVENMSFADVEKTIGELGKKGKENKISVEEMQGGTFTISNGGVYGSMMGTPIINPPQSAILGMHGIQEQPVVVNGEIVIRPMMYLALTYDHRLIDGRDAVLFLRKIKEGVEDPRTLLLDL